MITYTKNTDNNSGTDNNNSNNIKVDWNKDGLMDLDWGIVCLVWFGDDALTSFFEDSDLETFILIQDGVVLAVMQVQDLSNYVPIKVWAAIPGHGYGEELMELVLEFYLRVPISMAVGMNQKFLTSYTQKFGFKTNDRNMKGVVNLNKPGTDAVLR